ncbi:Peptide-methionine (S)-S-oxide reductase [Tulasnella sp. 408]|nr:Peptide-methionine (S)-S-oxide reductase [Tulasnella sp. 408]
MTIVPGSLVPTIPSAIASYKTTSKNTQPSGKGKLYDNLGYSANRAQELSGMITTVEVATFAHGCFWGTQELFDKYFGPTRGVKTTVGYAGGDENIKNPTYDQVCSGTTGFAEASKIEYDPALVGYAELVEYRSAIFIHSPGQTQIARKVTDEVQEKYFNSEGLEIVTVIDDARTWYDAEDYHQKKYVELNPDHGSTHNTLHW